MLNDGSFVKLSDAEHDRLINTGTVSRDDAKARQSAEDILRGKIIKKISKSKSITLGRLINGFRTRRELVLDIVSELRKENLIEFVVTEHNGNGSDVVTLYKK